MIDATVISQLYDAGLTDEGYPFHAEMFVVRLENSRGRRFHHVHGFYGAERSMNADGEVNFGDRRVNAELAAQKLCDKVNKALEEGHKLDKTLWVEVDPAYGSDEYSSQGTEEKNCFLEKQAGMHE
jgi:hypothetical protein